MFFGDRTSAPLVPPRTRAGTSALLASLVLIGCATPQEGGTGDSERVDAAPFVREDASADGSPDSGPVETSCDEPAQVVFYGERFWNPLADALAAAPGACADYFISIPARSGDKTFPRGDPHVSLMHARGPRFHALAEFHFASWASLIESTGMTWREAGVEFRRRMQDAGYDVAAGDGWAVNELPSSIRREPALRDRVVELVQGLHQGPEGAPEADGALFIIGLGQSTENFSVYRPRLRVFLEDTSFWNGIAPHVRFFAQEVYTDPDRVCVGSAVTGKRAVYVNDYVQHVARFAEVGGASTAAARNYLRGHYLPLMNAAWHANGYGNTDILKSKLKHHISTQVYAARAWAGKNPYPEGRLGFAWSPRNVDADPDFGEKIEDIAARLASAVRHAYAPGGAARHACSPSGAYTWCQCSVPGASFNDGWKTFATW